MNNMQLDGIIKLMKHKIRHLFKKEPKHKEDKKPKLAMTNKDYERLGRRMQQVFETGYASMGRLMYVNFFRGIAYGVGWFIGATLVVGILLAMLVNFEDAPVVGPAVQHINDLIEQGESANSKVDSSINNQE